MTGISSADFPKSKILRFKLEVVAAEVGRVCQLEVAGFENDKTRGVHSSCRLNTDTPEEVLLMMLTRDIL